MLKLKAIAPLAGILILAGATGCQRADSAPGPSAQRGPVSSQEELMARLRAAKGGEVILVAPGRYPDMNINGRSRGGLPTFSRPVTIKAAGPGVTFVGQTRIHNLARLTLDGIAFENPTMEKKWDPVISIRFARNVHIVRARVTGRVSDGESFGKGIAADNCDGLEISDSDFSATYRAMAIENSDHISIHNNFIHDLGSDGIDLAAITDVVVRANHMRSFNPVALDHADGVQGFSRGKSRGLTDVVIEDNLIEGTAPAGSEQRVQGVFIRSEIVKQGIRHKNIRVANNVIVDSNYHGISISDTDGVAITGNKVLWRRDVPRAGKQRYSWIRTDNSTDVVVTGNLASKLIPQTEQPGTWRGNQEKTVSSREASAAVAAWMAAHPR